MHIKDEMLSKGTFELKDGTNTRFWEDTWLVDQPLKVKYPNLYNIVRDPHATVSKVLATSPLNISFRRALVDNKLREWLNLVAKISHVQLVEGSDYFKWSLTKSGLYNVRSLYCHLIDTHPPFRHGRIWKMKIPLKIKIFSQQCISCNRNENIQHLFLDCCLLKQFRESPFLLLI
jgi:hypothetical protein